MTEIPRKKLNLQSRNKKAAKEKTDSPGGLSFGPYTPRYKEPYNIYEKAKNHAREQRRNCKKLEEKRGQKSLKKDEKSC